MTWSEVNQDLGSIVAPAPLVTLTELKTFMRYSNPSSAHNDDSILSDAIQTASEFIENAIGPISPTTFVEREDGWAGDTIMLRHIPVISINYVNEYWSTGGLHVLSESTPSATVDGYQLEKTTGRLVRVFAGNWPRTWFPGSLNVEVSYVAGYSTTPATLKWACYELAEHWFSTGPGNIAKGFGGSFNDPDDVGEPAGVWIGIPNKVTEKLSRFRTPVLG